MHIPKKQIALTVKVLNIAVVMDATAQFVLGKAIGVAWQIEGDHHYFLVQRRIIEGSASLYSFALWHLRITFALIALAILGGLLQWILVDRFKTKIPSDEQPTEGEAPSFRMALAKMGTPQASVAATTEINETIDDLTVHDHFVIDDRKFVFHGRHLHVSAGENAPREAKRRLVDA